MNHAIGSHISGVLTLSLGLWVLVQNKGSMQRKVFAWLCLTIFTWFFSYGVMESATDWDTALLWAQIGHTGAILCPTAYVHFTRYFLKLDWLRYFYRWFYAIALSFVGLMWMSDKVVQTVANRAWGYYPAGDAWMLGEVIFCILEVAFGGILFLKALYQARVNSQLREYNVLKYSCLALLVFSFGGLDYLPKFGILFPPPGFITTGLFVSLVAYTILVHRLMDINIVIRKSLVYSTLVALISAVYFSVVLLIEKLLQGLIGYRSLIGSVIAGFTIALGFTPLKEFIQQLVDHLFFKRTQLALAQENEKLRQEICRTEKLRAVAELASGMAHEIKNPLASIKTFADFLPTHYGDSHFRSKFQHIVIQEVDRINNLIQHLLDFAKPATPHLSPIRISDVANETIDFIDATLKNQQIKTELRFAQKDKVLADRGQIRQVFLNLLLNSIEAMEGPGNLRITTSRENGHLKVEVQDTGCGIPKKNLPRLFNPFYTTKPKGTGLGLAVVHNIVKAHRGRIAIESEPGKGTIVRLRFPLANETGDSRLETQDQKSDSDGAAISIH